MSNPYDPYRSNPYQSGSQPGLQLRMPRSVTAWLIILNLAFFILDWLSGYELSRWMVVTNQTLSHPSEWYRFLSYAFAHAGGPGMGMRHIGGNMILLFFFGGQVEQRIGNRREYLIFYLTAAVLGGFVWGFFNSNSNPSVDAAMLGASGACVAVLIYFCCAFPHQEIRLFFVLPMPTWVLGLIVVGADLYGMLAGGHLLGGQSVGNVAYSVHIVGAAFGFLYCHNRWNILGFFSKFKRPKGPKLRVYNPTPETQGPEVEEVDRILQKIHSQGQASLTNREKKILEEASRKFRDRK